MKFDIDRLTTAIQSDTAEEKLFIKHCREYGLEPNLLHSRFTRLFDNKIFEITGLSKRGRLAVILANEVTESGELKNFAEPFDIRKILQNKFFNWC